MSKYTCADVRHVNLTLSYCSRSGVTAALQIAVENDSYLRKRMEFSQSLKVTKDTLNVLVVSFI